MSRASDTVRFALVGAVGFWVDAGVLAALSGALGPYLARVPSFALAVLATWLLNRKFTFAPSGRGMSSEGARYAIVQVAGALANLAVYATLMAYVPWFAQWPIAALAMGAVAGMAVNLTGSRMFVFTRG